MPLTLRALTIAFAAILSLVGFGARAQVASDGSENSAIPTMEAIRADVPEGPDALVVLGRCDAGSAVACSELGDRFILGNGVIKSGEIAKALYAQACNGGDTRGCDYSRRLADPDDSGVKEELELARLAADCDSGAMAACAQLAQKAIEPDSAVYDPLRAVALATKACDAKLNAGCLVLADILTAPGPQTDRARAIRILAERCEAESVEACLRGASAAEIDSPGSALAYRLHSIACDRSSELACIELARRDLADNRDEGVVARSLDRACELADEYCADRDHLRDRASLAKACDGGDVAVCGNLGERLGDSNSLFRSDVQAKPLLERACSAGMARSCWRAYELGRQAAPVAGSADALALMAQLETACASAVERSCLELGEALHSGRLGPQDDRRAAPLLQTACKAEGLGCAELEELAGIVPGVEIPLARDNYVPPDFDPDSRVAERSDRSCSVVHLLFRGKQFTQSDCKTIARGIKGFRAKPGSAPWQAMIERPERFGPRDRVACGGSLVAPGWILTAAHCTYDRGSNLARDGYRVRLGVDRPGADEGVTYRIARAIPHPSFIRKKPKDPTDDKAWDIALLRIDDANPEKRGSVLPIARIRLDYEKVGERPIADTMPVYAYGWGWTAFENSDTTETLQGIRMNLVNEEKCARILKFSGPKKFSALCAGGPNGEQTCFGDSGGPLVYYGDADRRPTLIGVVSSGFRCGTLGKPSQYTRVAAVREWIDKTIAGATPPAERAGRRP